METLASVVGFICKFIQNEIQLSNTIFTIYLSVLWQNDEINDQFNKLPLAQHLSLPTDHLLETLCHRENYSGQALPVYVMYLQYKSFETLWEKEKLLLTSFWRFFCLFCQDTKFWTSSKSFADEFKGA